MFEKTKSWAKDHWYELTLIGVAVVGMGAMVGGSVHYDKKRYEKYCDTCDTSLGIEAISKLVECNRKS